MTAHPGGIFLVVQAVSPENSWNDLGMTPLKYLQRDSFDWWSTWIYDISWCMLISSVCAAQCKSHSTLSGSLTVLSALKMVLPTFAHCFWQNPSTTSSFTESKAGSKMSLGVSGVIFNHTNIQLLWLKGQRRDAVAHVSPGQFHWDGKEAPWSEWSRWSTKCQVLWQLLGATCYKTLPNWFLYIRRLQKITWAHLSQRWYNVTCLLTPLQIHFSIKVGSWYPKVLLVLVFIHVWLSWFFHPTGDSLVYDRRGFSCWEHISSTHRVKGQHNNQSFHRKQFQRQLVNDHVDHWCFEISLSSTVFHPVQGMIPIRQAVKPIPLSAEVEWSRTWISTLAKESSDFWENQMRSNHFFCFVEFGMSWQFFRRKSRRVIIFSDSFQENWVLSWRKVMDLRILFNDSFLNQCSEFVRLES